MLEVMKALREFHRKYNHYEFHGYEVPPEVIELRIKLINEEVNNELLLALRGLKIRYGGMDIEEYKERITELADALADSIYVIVGTAISFGIPLDLVFNEVHRSNMTKSMEKDTKSIKGKTIKGPDYDPPNLRKIIDLTFK